jgi:hypothetical protein
VATGEASRGELEGELLLCFESSCLPKVLMAYMFEPSVDAVLKEGELYKELFRIIIAIAKVHGCNLCCCVLWCVVVRVCVRVFVDCSV